jgi:hypothetical protein
VFLFQTKNCKFSQLKHRHHNLTTRQPTNFGMQNQSFVLTARVFAERFKPPGIYWPCLNKNVTICTVLSNTDFNECGIFLTANAYLCRMQCPLVHFFGSVFIRATKPRVSPVLHFVVWHCEQYIFFYSIWLFIRKWFKISKCPLLLFAFQSTWR